MERPDDGDAVAGVLAACWPVEVAGAGSARRGAAGRWGAGKGGGLSGLCVAGIGLVAPDAIALLTQKDQLSESEYNEKALGVVGKGALATALVCAGPVGWLGLAGLSIASAYGKATAQGTASQLRSS